MEIRSLFQKIFGRKETSVDVAGERSTMLRLLGRNTNYFYPLPDNLYEDATIRTCIDTIARNAAKMQIKHIRRDDKGHVIRASDKLDYLLSNQPNEFMSSYDFLYKVVTMLYTKNNAFIDIKTDDTGNIIGLYPLSYNGFELREYNGEVYVKFQFAYGQNTIPYKNLIHLRRHINDHDILGESNQNVMSAPLRILNAITQAMESAVKNSAKLRGILKIVGNLRKEDRDKQLSIFNSSINPVDGMGTGTAVLDDTADYKQITNELKTMDYQSMKFVLDNVYSYFGLNEDIITSSFNAETWNSFYESVLEPLSMQFAQEFTNKLFTLREKQFGNEIIFTVDRLQYSDMKDKVEMASVLQTSGILTINEIREIFGYDPIADGDERLISLNNVKADDMTEYQLGRAKEKTETEKTETEKTNETKANEENSEVNTNDTKK